MERSALTACLSRHGITYRIASGRVMALEVATVLERGVRIGADSWVDVTEWKRGQLLAWLGY